MFKYDIELSICTIKPRNRRQTAFKNQPRDMSAKMTVKTMPTPTRDILWHRDHGNP